VKKIELSLPELFFVAATRGALGAGVGLLLADKLRRSRRCGIGRTLVAIGALTTIPAAVLVYRRATRKPTAIVAAA
jgi:hypothetical protein